LTPDAARLDRRRALGILGGAAALCAGCGGSSSPTGASAVSTPSPSPSSGAVNAAGCAVTAEETAGPYPDQLGMSNNQAFYRRDITEGRAGTPLALALTIVNARNNCNALANANVEVWQCAAAGNYSEYAQPGYNGTGQTFLRGLQTSDASGRVTFNTIYPGWYMGRATHIHVQVFVGGALVKTTQVAFPEDVSHEVYAQGAYAPKGQNTTSNASDNVFSDGTGTEMVTIAGSPAAGYMAALTLVVSA
jgi:protocatechuate 3,4-dioxygenase beta subunit